MAYVLRDGIFQVKCRQQGCPFKSEFKIGQTIMGATDKDCESEAMKIARNMAAIKHDAIYGRTHILKDPIVRKIGGAYAAFGAGQAPGAARTAARAVEPGIPRPPGATAVKKYAKGEVILRKGDRASTVCEVISGAAYPENTTAIRYEAGRSFGAAGLLSNQERTGSVLADADDTVVAFYNMQEVSKTNPAKARELYNEVMEDTLHVIAFLDDRVDELEGELAAMKAKAKTAKAPARKSPKAKAAGGPTSRKKG
jgi:hypothetical protein